MFQSRILRDPGAIEGGGSINVADGALARAQASLPKAVTVTTLATNASGKFDLTDNKLVVTGGSVGSWNGSAYTDVTGLVDSGRGNASNAQWNGNGIVTSDTRAVNNNDLVSIGTATASQVKNIAATATATFAGRTVLGSDVIAMVTWGGDANLDGDVSFPDFVLLADNFGQTGGWGQGDFDADGQVQFPDFVILADNYGQVAAAAVPEPWAMLLLIMGCLIAKDFRRKVGR